MRVKFKNVRFSFLNVRTPYVNTEKDGTIKKSWKAAGICDENTTFEATAKDGSKKELPHTEFSKILDKVCKDKWGKTVAQMGPKFQVFAYNRADVQVGSRGPRVDDSGAYYDGYTAETYFVSASADVAKRPDGIVIVGPRASDGPLPASSGHPYSGDYGHILIDVYAFDGDNGRGITCSLEGVQYTRKGEPFGNVAADASAFDDEELEDDELENESAENGEDDLF